MNGRQELVAVAEVVLAELSCRVALRLEQIGEGRILFRQTLLRGRQAHFQEAGAQRALAGDERCPAGGAGLLAVVVREDRAFAGDAVNIRRPVTHHAAIVGTDVPVADVISHDHEDVGLLLLRHRGCGRHCHGSKRCQQARHRAKHSWPCSSPISSQIDVGDQVACAVATPDSEFRAGVDRVSNREKPVERWETTRTIPY